MPAHALHNLGAHVRLNQASLVTLFYGVCGPQWNEKFRVPVATSPKDIEFQVKVSVSTRLVILSVLSCALNIAGECGVGLREVAVNTKSLSVR